MPARLRGELAAVIAGALFGWPPGVTKPADAGLAFAAPATAAASFTRIGRVDTTCRCVLAAWAMR